MSTTFLQQVFNDISLQKEPQLWLSSDDRLTGERLRHLATFPETRFAGQLQPEAPALRLCRKNGPLAAALREKGHLAYAQGDGQAALALYNQCLQFAPPGHDGQLAEVLAGRAAVWIDRKMWAPALRDLDAALAEDAGYPRELRYKLLEQKARCQVSRGQAKEAGKTVEDALAALEASKLKGGRKRAKEDQLRGLLRQRSSLEEDEAEQQSGLRPVPALAQPHARFPSFSDAVSVVYEAGRGRFCVARRQIESGELIAVEQPFACMLDKEEVRRLCWNCFRPFLAPVPCRSCSGVLFCGETCLADSESYHKFECGTTELMYQANLGAWSLGYRAVISKPSSYYLENRSLFAGRHERRGVDDADADDQEVYSSQDVLSFHSLVTHDNAHGKEAAELMMQALAAVFLLRCLQHNKYLPEPEPETAPGALSETELFFAELLHHFMRVAYYNTHELTLAAAAVDVNADITSGPSLVRRVGRGTNPSLALLNHSCDPNYRRVSVGRHTLGFATKTIAAGDEITDTYCVTFAAASKEARRDALAKYKFVCACAPCREDWPLLRELPKKVGGPYLKSEGPDKVAVKKVKAAEGHASRVPKGDKTARLAAQKNYYDQLQALLKPPHYQLTVAEHELYLRLVDCHACKSDDLYFEEEE